MRSNDLKFLYLSISCDEDFFSNGKANFFILLVVVFSLHHCILHRILFSLLIIFFSLFLLPLLLNCLLGHIIDSRIPLEYKVNETFNDFFVIT